MESIEVCWDEFGCSLGQSINKMSREKLLFDMGIAVDGQILKAHQVVVGSSSPLLLDLLVGARDAAGSQFPVLLLTNTSAQDLQLILRFIYTGKVVVPEERLSYFLSTAEELQIRGLSAKLPTDSSTSAPILDNTENLAEHALETRGSVIIKRKADDEESSIIETKDHKSQKFEGLLKCENCDRTFDKRYQLLRHEKVHSDFRPFVCKICDQKFKRKEHCHRHISTVHDTEACEENTVLILLTEVMDAIQSADGPVNS